MDVFSCPCTEKEDNIRKININNSTASHRQQMFAKRYSMDVGRFSKTLGRELERDEFSFFFPGLSFHSFHLWRGCGRLEFDILIPVAKLTH